MKNNNWHLFVNSSQKKAHLQRRCAFFNEIRLRRVKFGFAKWNTVLKHVWNICFANVKGEFNFTSNGVRYFIISARKLFHIRSQPNISLFSPNVLKNTENCAIIKPERRWRYEKIFLFNIVVSIDDLYICNVYIL